ncbi:MAG: shikimate dehydrogenase [Oscillospiraceae bacterium]|jgi:shikimate dehydrogenase|nr:shikimate dehydrogenase [Oscillospiraceae bacterium]
MKKFRLAVIGTPVSHSLSPRIHGAFAEALGLEVGYDAVEVAPEELRGFVTRSRRDYDGYNITMPHKETVAPLLDALGDTAAACGAVNTVVNVGGRLTGHITDGAGILRSLEPYFGSYEGKNAVIIGAGGAAKTAAVSLSGAGADVTCVSRRAAAVAGAKRADFASLETLAETADVIINCTPLGMSGHDAFADFDFLAGVTAVVFDLVYNPRQTELLGRARSLGLRTVEGVSLLVWQAAYAFELFTGTQVPRELAERVMREL